MSVGHGVPPKVVSMQKGFWHTDIPVDAGITYWTFHQQWLYGHKKQLTMWWKGFWSDL